MEAGSPHARYAILEEHEGGRQAEQIAVRYDWESAARTAIRNGRADWAFRWRNGRAKS